MSHLIKISQFTGKTFALWVILFAVLGFAFPSQFTWISPYITILLGVIMFGMGLTLSADDFKELLRRPLQVLIGVLVQYTIMPLTAFGLAYGLQPPFGNCRRRHSGRLLSRRNGFKCDDIFG